VFAACAVGDAALLAVGRAFEAIASECMCFLACFLLIEHLGQRFPETSYNLGLNLRRCCCTWSCTRGMMHSNNIASQLTCKKCGNETKVWRWGFVMSPKSVAHYTACQAVMLMTGYGVARRNPTRWIPSSTI
jgi:hypothetical protein